MSKQFWGVIIVLIMIIVGVSAFSGKSSAPTTNAQATDHTKGAGNKGVTLVEYGDFQCPFCAQYYPTLEQVIAEYGDDITFQFRHFPLTNIHQNAFAASRAAEAAGLQDKFFDMYGLLYQNQNAWSTTNSPQTTFEGYAQRLNLDVEKFKTDYASSEVNGAILADSQAGAKLDVQSTPTFILNGKSVQIANNFEAFKKAIDSEIARQDSSKTPDAEATETPATP